MTTSNPQTDWLDEIWGQVNAYVVMKGGNPNAKTLGAYTAQDNINRMVQAHIETIERGAYRRGGIDELKELVSTVPYTITKKEDNFLTGMMYVKNKAFKRIEALKKGVNHDPNTST